MRLKVLAFNILESLDACLLRCRWRSLCAWLLYSDYWKDARDIAYSGEMQKGRGA